MKDKVFSKGLDKLVTMAVKVQTKLDAITDTDVPEDFISSLKEVHELYNRIVKGVTKVFKARHAAKLGQAAGVCSKGAEILLKGFTKTSDECLHAMAVHILTSVEKVAKSNIANGTE